MARLRQAPVRRLDPHHFVRRAEAVKEVDERGCDLEGGGARDQGEVGGLLHGIGGEPMA